MDQRALAGAARSHHGHYFSRRYFQIDVAQNFPRLVAVGFVGKAHIFEADAGGEGAAAACAPGFSRTSSSVSINLKISEDAPMAC